jgi:chemotaxis protein methyltransferase CheR
MLSEFISDRAGEAAVLSASQFSTISRIIHERCGICFPTGKEVLVRSRLMKRLRVLGLSSFDQYLRYIDEDSSGNELATMIDALTTNKTNFFREPHHFEFLKDNILPELRESNSKVRFWSAGCSTGEEPYSLAILLNEELSQQRRGNCQILATDISRRVLAVAQEALYSEESLQGVHPSLWKKHMVCVQSKPGRVYRISDEARALVRFAYLNLTASWPMKGPFDAIFCRNVMIYFDGDTRKKLVRRFYDLIKPGGYLFVGHSESLGSTSWEFRYVEPAVYVK